MSTIARGGLAVGPFFDVGAGWLPTAQQLEEAGLPAGPLAAARLDVVRISLAGKWHPVSPGTSAAGCARVRRAAADGRELIRRQAGLLAGLGLCRACTARIRLPGRAGAYLDLARHVIAASAWVQALEQAAREADWPAYVRWTARSPFAGENVLALLGTLGGDLRWQPARHAATMAWRELWDRADAAQARARLAAGPPGLHAHAAAARALVAAQQDTVMENDLIGAISASPRWEAPAPAPAWDAAAQAWTQAICQDADPAAARTALAAAIERLYATAQARDVALLPPVPAFPGEDFCSPAAWADAEYQAVRETITQRWCQRLEAALAEIQAEATEVTGQWRLLLIAGWPTVADRDRGLAYLAHYPELARTPPIPALGTGPECLSRVIVVLHVPGFAAHHAAAHQSPNLTATAGPVVASSSAPSADQVRALFRYATAVHAGRERGQALGVGPGRPAGSNYGNGAENQ